jgi:hypothetical protein
MCIDRNEIYLVAELARDDVRSASGDGSLIEASGRRQPG